MESCQCLITVDECLGGPKYGKSLLNCSCRYCRPFPIMLTLEKPLTVARWYMQSLITKFTGEYSSPHPSLLPLKRYVCEWTQSTDFTSVRDLLFYQSPREERKAVSHGDDGPGPGTYSSITTNFNLSIPMMSYLPYVGKCLHFSHASTAIAPNPHAHQTYSCF